MEVEREGGALQAVGQAGSVASHLVLDGAREKDNEGSVRVLRGNVTRVNGECLHGVPMKHYSIQESVCKPSTKAQCIRCLSPLQGHTTNMEG